MSKLYAIRRVTDDIIVYRKIGSWVEATHKRHALGSANHDIVTDLRGTKVKWSDQMIGILELASEQGRDIHYVPLVDGRGSQSRTVGRATTIEAMRRHGLLGRQDELTTEGRRVLTAARERRDRALGIA